MIYKNKLIKNLLIKIIEYCNASDNRIKKIEYIRGLYRYPNKLLGRTIGDNYSNDTDILVFAAHPDDDVLGLGTTLCRHSLNNENIKVIFVTNGTGRGGESWITRIKDSVKKSTTRYGEAVEALTLINLPKENIWCLGYPDGGTQRYIKDMSVDIFNLVDNMSPKRIYVHCIEGGHIDHDITSFIVKSVCNAIGYSNVFEWTEYHPKQPLGAQVVSFLANGINDGKEIKIDISDEERLLKRKMLACHQSQDVEQFYLQGEAIRQGDITNVDKQLLEYCQLSYEKLNQIVKEFKKIMNTILIHKSSNRMNTSYNKKLMKKEN